MASSREVIITKLQRDSEEGFWTCNITSGGKTHHALSRHGSWMIDAEDGLMKEVMPDVAAKIQEKVRPIEKKERIAREKSEGKNDFRSGTTLRQPAAGIGPS